MTEELRFPEADPFPWSDLRVAPFQYPDWDLECIQFRIVDHDDGFQYAEVVVPVERLRALHDLLGRALAEISPSSGGGAA